MEAGKFLHIKIKTRTVSIHNDLQTDKLIEKIICYYCARMKKNFLELLSPAKDLECGKAAINCGADAVYIGAPKFGARAAAGNSIADIEKLCGYAHKFWSKAYVVVNTIIYEDELEEAEKLIRQVYEIGADAVIIQDAGIFEMNLPPIPIFASTQMHNYSLERIKFLESAGVQRIILARELSLEQIRKIKSETNIELESFVHGALCVSFSGQCYISHESTGRSANRGECSQSCRLSYTLEDRSGKQLVKDKYLLSLKDLNLSESLEDLIDAGITSFKIEGRLKDIDYVKNVTAHYRNKLDSIVEKKKGFKKSSSGKSIFNFAPDPSKSFNRGFTNYFIEGRKGNISSFHSQKSIGKFLGKVVGTGNGFFEIETKEKIVNGDGICYFDNDGTLCGMNVNKIEGTKFFSSELKNITPGTEIFRNHDHQFLKEVLRDETRRQIDVEITIHEKDKFLLIEVIDEDDCKVVLKVGNNFEPANNKQKAAETIEKQFRKSGDSIFSVSKIEINLKEIPFIQTAELNKLRREVLDMLLVERENNFPKLKKIVLPGKKTYPEKKLDYRANVVNSKAEKFYREHGVEKIEQGFEVSNSFENLEVMRMKYCIKEQLDVCPKQNKNKPTFEEPLYLKNLSRKYRLVFDCKKCEMGLVNTERSDV